MSGTLLRLHSGSCFLRVGKWRRGRRYAVQSHGMRCATNHIHRTDAVCFHRVARDSSASLSLSLSLLYFVWVSSAALTYTD